MFTKNVYMKCRPFHLFSSNKKVKYSKENVFSAKLASKIECWRNLFTSEYRLIQLSFPHRVQKRHKW